MELGAADDDAVRLALDDAHVGVGVVLLVRRTAAVALGVGDALGDADVALLRVVDLARMRSTYSGHVVHLPAAVSSVMIDV